MTDKLTALVRPGKTCWRVEHAQRVACLVDAETYFCAACSALSKARHSIFLLGWDFDPRTRLQPGTKPQHRHAEFGALLQELATRRPGLHIHILVWDMILPIAALRQGYPQRSRRWFDGHVHFRLDSAHPAGACHHQKVLVVDDAVAFCGGSDFAADRWDSRAHLDCDQRRRLPSGRQHPPRHDVMMLVDGAAAGALADLARIRWQRSTGEQIEPVTGATHDPWPDGVTASLVDAPVAIVRTEPQWEDRPAVLENEALHLKAIARARRTIYLENQYLVAPAIGEALAARLAEADGPELVVVCPSRSPSYFDRFAIDVAQRSLLAQLAAADRRGRFRAYTPVTRGGHDIIVHSKVTIIDDRLLRVGSANLNNRSLGFDTECDLAIDSALTKGADRTRTCAAIERFRNTLLAHHLGVAPEPLTAAIVRNGLLIAGIEALGSTALRPVGRSGPEKSQSLRSLVAEYHLGDPERSSDAWRPWRRRSRPPRTRL